MLFGKLKETMEIKNLSSLILKKEIFQDKKMVILSSEL